MPSVLAVFGTSYGQTERITRRIACQLTRQGIAVTVMRGTDVPDTVRLDEYDGFLVAASVLGGHHQAYIEEFVRRRVAQLSAVPSAFVSVSGSAGSPRPENQAAARGYVEEFCRKTCWQPSMRATFGGCMAYTKYGFFLRWVTMLVSRRRGGPTDMSRDHESTDWKAVDRFAAEFGTAFAASPAGRAS